VEFVEQVIEDHMVAAFVQAEIDSARFSKPYREGLKYLGVGRGGLVDRPDLTNKTANDRRRLLLREIRGYGVEKYLFRGWPTDIEWWRVQVLLDELKTFKFANYQTWIDLTKGTRLVSDGAANVDTVPVAENANANIKAVAALVRQGHRFPNLILLAQQQEGPFVVMEGHTRATAYVLAGDPDPVDCLLGISQLMNSWFYWGAP
jgi:hypothetical protein